MEAKNAKSNMTSLWFSVEIVIMLVLMAGLLWWAHPWSSAEVFRPGAAGAGDPYFPLMGNGGYDVQHYDLALSFDPTDRSIDASVDIAARATQNLSRFDLDFRQPLQVKSVTVDGKTATFSRDGVQELVVTPQQGVANKSDFKVKVSYSGRPQNIYKYGPNGWMETSDGVVAMPQPNSTETFMPNNGIPSDKATYDFAITVPKGLQVVANGEPNGTTVNGDRATYKWHDGNQTPSELVMLAIGHFDIIDTKTTDGIRNITAIDPAAVEGPVAAANDEFNQRTGDITAWVQNKFGPYPFTSTGGLQDFGPDINFSEEMVTRPAYVHGQSTIPSTRLVVHELTHQYYGDLVTPASWRDVWLNESFATYAEWMYEGEHGGMTPQQHFDELYNDPETDWTNKVGDPGVNHFFDDLVYQRGAMAIHQLRLAVGEETFSTLLKAWPAEHKNASASVKDYIAFAQRVSHKDLSKLFNAWLYSEGKPIL